jgi:ribulose-phosphate 3-epimerase
MEIIPAILTDDIGEAREMIIKIRESGKFDRVQVDFVDGEYNSNRTFLPGDILVSEFEGLKFDAHLMVTQNNIVRWVNEAEVAGYDRIISQLESISEPEDFRGLAMDVHSPVAAIEPYLPGLEVVIVMAVEPGFGGQDFSDEVIEAIKRLSELKRIKNYKYRICVDGGVEKEHMQMLEEAGADEVAVGVKRALIF